MKTAKIKCPKCGKEGYVIPGDLDKADLTYQCDQCGESFEVSFFDYCPTCKVNVGFLEGNAFKKDMISMGKDIISTVINPVSAIDLFGGYFKNAFVGDVDEANGDGICPICHTRYIRCHSCHELFAIKLDAVYKDKFKCSSCGLIQFPGHVKEGRERLHSAAFLSDKRSGREKQRMQFQNPKKKPIDSVPPKTTQITRREAFKIISFVMHIQIIDGSTSVSLGRSALKSFRKKGYNIPERVMYQCRTYNDLADAIIAFKANQYTTEPSKSSKTFSSDLEQGQMLTQQMNIENNQQLNLTKAETNMENQSQIPEGCTIQGYTSDGFAVYGHDEYAKEPFRMTVEDIFQLDINGGLCVLTGRIESGCVRSKSEIFLNCKDSSHVTTVLGIEMSKKLLPCAEKGDYVGILISKDMKDILYKGMVITSEKPELFNCNEHIDSQFDNEMHYLENLKEFLEDDAEITPHERKMLDRIRQSLGISEERAKELEESLKPKLTEDEQEYLDMYKEYAKKGEVTEKERRRLDIFATVLGISEDRIREVEKL